MTWVDSIQELDYYSRGASDYCYCDLIVQPSDLAIQGILKGNSVASDLRIEMYTPDGLGVIADVTEYFDWYIAKLTGRSFFIAKLRYFPQIMCDNRCFVLRAVVDYMDNPGFGDGQPRFNRMTQQYCLADCCVAADGVVISGGGVTQHDASLPATVSSPKDIMCRPLLRMAVRFDCIDRFTGDYWALPPVSTYVNGSVAAADMFAFTKVLNITGTVLPEAWDIKRTISLNCRVQRTESTPMYDVQSFEEFPLWKMREISDMLHANHLEMNGREYIFPGGVAFERLNKKRPCKQYYRLKFAAQDCTQYQSYGCGVTCDGESIKYYAFKNQASLYYDDAGRPIGTFNDVLNWFNTGGGGQYGGVAIQGGTLPPIVPWSATVVDPPPPVPAPYFKIVAVEGENLPVYIYGDTTRPAGRIYAQDLINEDYNALFGLTVNHVECAIPLTGAPSFYDMVCGLPVVGVPTFTDNCKLPVLGIPVYGDLDGDVPIDPGVDEYILLEDESGSILSEDGDLLISE